MNLLGAIYRATIVPMVALLVALVLLVETALAWATLVALGRVMRTTYRAGYRSGFRAGSRPLTHAEIQLRVTLSESREIAGRRKRQLAAANDAALELRESVVGSEQVVATLDRLIQVTTERDRPPEPTL